MELDGFPEVPRSSPKFPEVPRSSPKLLGAVWPRRPKLIQNFRNQKKITEIWSFQCFFTNFQDFYDFVLVSRILFLFGRKLTAFLMILWKLKDFIIFANEVIFSLKSTIAQILAVPTLLPSGEMRCFGPDLCCLVPACCPNLPAIWREHNVADWISVPFKAREEEGGITTLRDAM